MATPIPDNQARFSLSQVAAATGGRLRPELEQRQVRGVVTDSRRVQPGNLYVALRGEHHDGHAFVADARARGAAAVLVEHGDSAADSIVVPDTVRALGDLAALHRTRWPGRVVAITGSAGKTTTKELTAAALRAAGAEVVSTQGNLNNLIGVPMTLFCLDASSEIAVLELGTSAPGEIARLAELCAPEVGVVTSISIAHTEGLGSLAAVATEKAALLRALPAEGTAIHPSDAPELQPELALVRARKLSFGADEGAGVRLQACELTADATSVCAFGLPGERVLSADLSLFGPGPALDAAAALGVLWAMLGEGAVARGSLGLSRVAPAPGRLEPLPGPEGSLILDDSYNANPASTAASLQALCALATARGGRALCALGDMRELGQHSRAQHEAVGRLVAELGVARFLGCGVEMVAAVEAAREANPALEAVHVSDASAVAAELRPHLNAADVVLIKGSRSLGMERAVDDLSLPEQPAPGGGAA